MTLNQPPPLENFLLTPLAERFFRKLKLVKNYLRSAMSQTRLVDLARLNTECSIARQVDFIVVL